MNSLNANQKKISTLLKLVVIISAVTGTFLSAYAGRHSFMGGSRYLCISRYNPILP